MPEPRFVCKIYTNSQRGGSEAVPDSFLESSRTSLSSVWFAGTTPKCRIENSESCSENILCTSRVATPAHLVERDFRASGLKQGKHIGKI